VANAVCLSPKYLSRVFKEKTGEDFNYYKLGIKISKAKELLTGTAKTVSEVSDKLGYRNAESFIRIFAKFTGKTPTGYRKRPAGNSGKKEKKSARKRKRKKRGKSAKRI